jgi:hypothetical protein
MQAFRDSEGLMTIVLPDAIAADSFPQIKL